MAYAPQVDQLPNQYDCYCCDFKENEQTIANVSMIGMSSAFGAAGTWLVSSVTSSLTGGVLGAVSTVISILALTIFEKMGLEEGEMVLAATLTTAVLNGVTALIATSVGFSVSLPLSLLYTASTVAAFITTIAVLHKK